MSQVYEIDPSRPDLSDSALDDATAALAKGHLVVLPTETVYGIAARPDQPEATRMIFEAKGRPLELSLPVLAASIHMAWEVATPTPTAERLAEAFWPGPLTMVLARSDRSRSWWLGERAESVGVRVPDNRLATAVMGRAGPLAVTSANLSGRAPIDAPEELVRALGAVVDVFLLVAPGARPPTGVPSSVVDLTSGTLRLLREGTIGAERLHEAASEP
jgi:tRNA threonylcarbamoyl adenosine modification protein (Sua5/YciO/YrdC/YwlC family)